MKFDQLLMYRALRFKAHLDHQAYNGPHQDKIMAELAEKHPDELKNVCAAISVPLFDRLTETLGILDMSKRQFIESALIDALDKADRILKEVDIWENAQEADPDEVFEPVRKVGSPC